MGRRSCHLDDASDNVNAWELLLGEAGAAAEVDDACVFLRCEATGIEYLFNLSGLDLRAHSSWWI